MLCSLMAAFVASQSYGPSNPTSTQSATYADTQQSVRLEH